MSHAMGDAAHENDRKDLIEDDCDHDDYEVDILTGRKDAYAEWEAAQNAWSIRARPTKGGE